VYSIQRDKVCERLATGWWFSSGTPVSSTNKTEHHDITEILLKVVLNTKNRGTKPPFSVFASPHDKQQNKYADYCLVFL
jgi:hypothetical protein